MRPFRAWDFAFLNAPGALPRAFLSHPFGVKNRDLIPSPFSSRRNREVILSLSLSDLAILLDLSYEWPIRHPSSVIRHSPSDIQYFQFHEILLAERKGASSKWFVSTYQIKEGPDAFKKPSYHIEP